MYTVTGLGGTSGVSYTRISDGTQATARYDGPFSESQKRDRKSVSIDSMLTRLNATKLCTALSRLTMRLRQVAQVAVTLRLTFAHVTSVYFKIKFGNPNIQSLENTPDTLDAVRARPAYRDTQDRDVAGRFDTVLMNGKR